MEAVPAYIGTPLMPSFSNFAGDALQPCEQLRHGHIKCPRQHFQVPDTNLLLPILQVRNEAAVHPDMLSHVDLRPIPLFAELAQSLAEPDANIAGHLSIIAVGLRR